MMVILFSRRSTILINYRCVLEQSMRACFETEAFLRTDEELPFLRFEHFKNNCYCTIHCIITGPITSFQTTVPQQDVVLLKVEILPRRRRAKLNFLNFSEFIISQTCRFSTFCEKKKRSGWRWLHVSHPFDVGQRRQRAELCSPLVRYTRGQ